MIHQIVLLTVILLLPSLAFAESTAEMLSTCKSLAETEVMDNTVLLRRDFATGMCWGAFSTLQRVIVMADSPGIRIFGACAPVKSSRTQLIAVFVEYARRNPQRLHEDFFVVAIDALSGAFPYQPR